MASLRVSSPGKVPSSYRNTLAIVPSPVSSFSEDDPFSFYQHSTLPKTTPMASAPVLPVKSDRRMSRLIIPTIHASVSPAVVDTTSTAPHDVYLSSEEDASSTPGDASDYNWDSETEEIFSPPATTVSVTARVISVVYSGKPSMVQLSGRRSTSPSPRVCIRQDSGSSVSSSPLPYSNSSVLSLPSNSSVLSLPSSTPSESCSASTRPMSMFVPTRPSSAFLPSSHALPRSRPSFLNIDPYATSAPPSTFSTDLTVSPIMNQDLSSPFVPSIAASTSSSSSRPSTASVDASPAPKTPTAMFKRTIDLVRKKSRPTLNAALVTSAREAIPEMPQTPQLQIQHETSHPNTPNTLPVTHNDMLRVSKRNVSSPHASSSASASASPQPVLSSAVRTRILSLARLRSSVRN
ncbi:hypothetical protein BROUX41_004616 [Berkeleyomyces rouxiae]